MFSLVPNIMLGRQRDIANEMPHCKENGVVEIKIIGPMTLIGGKEDMTYNT